MGRYPTAKEASQLGIRETAPVWLPLQQAMDVFTPDICERLRHIRNESSYFFSFENLYENISIISLHSEMFNLLCPISTKVTI